MKELLDIVGIFVSLVFVAGYIWLRIKSAEQYVEGLDRKSDIQTLFGDEDK